MESECKINDYVIYKNTICNIKSIFEKEVWEGGTNYTLIRRNRETGLYDFIHDVQRKELINENDLPFSKIVKI